jgi:hypothetical protein
MEGTTVVSAGDILNDNNKETGNWTFSIKGGAILSKGEFDNGLRKGLWTYKLHRDTLIKVDWSIYKNDTNSLIVNYPSDWQIFYNSGFKFIAAFPTISRIKDNKLVVILFHPKDSIKMNLDEYLNLYNRELAKFQIIKNYNFELKFKNSNTYYSVANYIRDNEELINLNYLYEDNKGIYDITFTTLNIDPEIKNQIFCDFISGLYIDGNRLFDPRQELKMNIKL